MQQTFHKSKSSLIREIDMYLKAGGRQVAVAYVKNDNGEMVYTFSRPEINKANEEYGCGN